MHELTPKQARKLVLNSQRMHSPNTFGRGVDAVSAAIEHLNYIQIDTISVIERAHHHTLWNRVNAYNARLLDLALNEARVFEYWSHAAAYLPMRDFRFTLPKKKELSEGGKHWYDKDPKEAAYVLAKIRSEGPLKASDFKQERSISGSGWGAHKPAKRSLERLFMEGKLMVSHRQGFQKVFDLTERVLPSTVDCRFPSREECLDYFIFSTLKANGLSTVAEICYLRKGIKADVQQRCVELLEGHKLVILKCGVKEYVATPNFETILSNRSSFNKVKIVSPFDNLLIQRQRMRDLFDYDYQIECYVPEAKRRFGYFVLPILMGQNFIGRLDAKIDRKSEILSIKNTYFELPNNKISQYDSSVFQTEFRKTLSQFLAFNGAKQLDFQRVFLNGKDVPWFGE